MGSPNSNRCSFKKIIKNQPIVSQEINLSCINEDKYRNDIIKVLSHVWTLYHRSKSLFLLFSTNKKPDFSDAQSYMRYLSEDLFSPI